MMLAVLGATGLLGGAVDLTEDNATVTYEGSSDPFEFDGQNGHASFTIEVWVAFHTGGTFRPIVSNYFKNTPSTDDHRGYMLHWQGGADELRFGRYQGNQVNGLASDVVGIDFAIESLPTAFHHVVATSDDTGPMQSQICIYLDGQKGQCETSTIAMAPDNGGVDARDLGVNTSGSSTLDAIVDEVAIYDKALEENDVLAHYCAGKDGR